MKSIRQKNPEFKNTITEIKKPSRGQMGLTAEADEINKSEKTSTHINMYSSHNVDRKSKFQKHTVQQCENMQNNTIMYVCTYVYIYVLSKL